MRSRSLVVPATLLALFMSFGLTAAHAQFKASIQGTVEDPKGEVVVGAKVNVTSAATGIGHDTVTNDRGFYRVNELQPGSYTVTVDATAFKQSISKEWAIYAGTLRAHPINESELKQAELARDHTLPGRNESTAAK